MLCSVFMCMLMHPASTVPDRRASMRAPRPSVFATCAFVVNSYVIRCGCVLRAPPCAPRPARRRGDDGQRLSFYYALSTMIAYRKPPLQNGKSPKRYPSNRGCVPRLAYAPRVAVWRHLLAGRGAACPPFLPAPPCPRGRSRWSLASGAAPGRSIVRRA